MRFGEHQGGGGAAAGCRGWWFLGLPRGKTAANAGAAHGLGFSPAGAAGGFSRATAGRGVLPRGKPANACQLFDLLGSREVGELAGQAEGARAGGRDEV